MNSVKKMKLVPFELDNISQEGGSLSNPITNKYRIKLSNIMKIISKLALIKGFDEYGRIRTKSGEFLDKYYYCMQ